MKNDCVLLAVLMALSVVGYAEKSGMRKSCLPTRFWKHHAKARQQPEGADPKALAGVRELSIGVDGENAGQR